MALDQRARRRLVQPTRQPAEFQVGIGQPYRDHRRQRHGEPFGATAQPGPQQLAQLLVAERARRGNAGRADQQGQHPIEPRAATLRRRFPRSRHLHGHRRARPLLPMSRQ